jgi:type III secretory pathway lipoprotein EscJ
MKRNIGICLIIIGALLATACSALNAPAQTRSSGGVAPKILSTMAASAPRPAAGESVSKDIAQTSNAVERIVIKNASLSLAVTDPIASQQAIARMAEGMGGFVVSSNSYKTTNEEGREHPAADITVRVPADNLESALQQIKAMVPDAKTDILNENISGQDVTKEYTDTESRLNNLKAAESQLVKIMENAIKTEDVMSVFRELTNVREQIEVLQGQLNYYKDAARLSAISVHLEAKEAIKPITTGGWQPGLEVQKALQSLVKGLTLLVNLLIFVIIVLVPIGLIIGLPAYLIVRTVRKNKPAVKSTEPKSSDVRKK